LLIAVTTSAHVLKDENSTFSGEFLRRDQCFGLHLPAETTYQLPLIQLEFEASGVVHVAPGEQQLGVLCLSPQKPSFRGPIQKPL
jgi:hypothetical protein